MSLPIMLALFSLYLFVLFSLGIKGYRETRNTSDYLLAGRQVHPIIMALSYGATFISTSAILGYGGAASIFGVGLIGTVLLIILIGVLLAFLLVGKRVRRMGQALGAFTFPELIGKRFESSLLQGLTALVIVIFMPIYIAVVLIGASRYVEATFPISFPVALTAFGLLVAAYVFIGGFKSVVYTDALQGILIFTGLSVLVGLTYWQLGGVNEAHKQLAALPAQIEAGYEKALPELKAAAPTGLEESEVKAWFVKTGAELKVVSKLPDEEKATKMAANPDLATVGKLLKAHPDLVNTLVVSSLSKGGFQGWTQFPKTGSPFFYVLISTLMLGMSVGMLAQPQLAVRFMTVKSNSQINRATAIGAVFFLTMVGVLMVGNLSNVWFHMPEHGGRISAAAVPGGNIDVVIPHYVNNAMPTWFSALFMLALLSAAMSTLSSQFHLMGTSIGRDLLGVIKGQDDTKINTILLTRVGIVISLVMTVALSFLLPTGIIAIATAVFAGLCASSFLPMYIGGMFWRRMTRAGALASLCTGFSISFFWLMFIQNANAKHPAFLAKLFFSKTSLLQAPVAGIHWNWIDALLIGLPAATLMGIVVSLLTQPHSAAHLARCFDAPDSQEEACESSTGSLGWSEEVTEH